MILSFIKKRLSVINMASLTTMTTLTMTLTTMKTLTITTTTTTTTTTTIVDSTIIIELKPQLQHLQVLELLQNLGKKDDLLRVKRKKNLLFMRHLHGIIYN